jgi:hypothetical protein
VSVSCCVLFLLVILLVKLFTNKVI